MTSSEMCAASESELTSDVVLRTLRCSRGDSSVLLTFTASVPSSIATYVFHGFGIDSWIHIIFKSYLLVLLCRTLGEGGRHRSEGGILEAREEQLARVEYLVVVLRRPEFDYGMMITES